MLQFFKTNSYNIFRMFLNQFGLALLAVIMSMATYENPTLFLLTSVMCTLVYIYILYTMTYEIGQKDKPAIDGKRAVLTPLKGFWMSLIANLPNIICGIMIAVFSLFLVFQQPVTVYNEAGQEVKLYTKDEKGNLSKTPVSLYSDTGEDAYIYETDYNRYTEIMDKSSTKIFVYDALGNEVDVFTSDTRQLSTSKQGVENWATNLYGVPFVIATFFQQIYSGIKAVLFGNSEYIYLLTPVLPILFCSIAYYFGATGKRLFFFLPERKQKPPKYR